MAKLPGLLIALGTSLAGIVPASAASFSSDAIRVAASQDLLEQAQYGGRCANWERECAKLYGWQTPQWHACMGQPGAIKDCGGSDGYDDGDRGRRGDRCTNWREECAKLYGRQTPQWNACMGQPGAIRDCRGGDDYYEDGDRGSRGQRGGNDNYEDDHRGGRGDRCTNWRQECAKLWGWRSRRWHQCMRQPGAIRDCRGSR